MLSELTAYLRLGFGHILDLHGYDHILFVIALVAGEGERWRRLFWLVTAFTIGHSVTLAIATLDLVRVNPALIEFLIPLTIVLTCVVNIATLRWSRGESAARVSKAEGFKYTLALGFGLIHGLGFSNFLRAALGAEKSLLVPLLGFNLGVEGGQLLIVLTAVLLARFVTRTTRLGARGWLLIVSTATGITALVMMIQRIP